MTILCRDGSCRAWRLRRADLSFWDTKQMFSGLAASFFIFWWIVVRLLDGFQRALRPQQHLRKIIWKRNLSLILAQDCSTTLVHENPMLVLHLYLIQQSFICFLGVLPLLVHKFICCMTDHFDRITPKSAVICHLPFVPVNVVPSPTWYATPNPTALVWLSV